MYNFIFVYLSIISIHFFTSDSLHVQDSIIVKYDSLAISLTDSTKDTTYVPESFVEPVLTFPSVENNAFQIGEKLTFKVRYGIVRAGTATMYVVKETMFNDRPAYHIQTTAESIAPFSWVYKVDDVVNSFIDKAGLFTLRYEKKIREGSYKVDLLVDYFPSDSLAKVDFIRYKDKTEKKKYDVKVPPFAFDVLASFYYVRTQPLRIGEVVNITNHDNKKVYNLEVHTYMRETINTAAGKFRCLRVEPLLKGEGVFKQKGRLLVWLTDDQYKIPVQMTSKVVVGHITTELEKIEGIKHKIPAMISK